ncbi:endonuclease VIII [Allokutzneria multivorans]|uniref:DNA-(apurinic or apyrimidinic site) lyase n=1 Tax=Allokutzneria multivorans TaxID=1142134 RepID=A0ABP7TJ54_9PSEU
MPEGDTVFLAGKRLNDALAGQRLQRGELRHPRLSTVDLAGRVVLEVRPVGKHLFFRFDDARSLHTHFRMDGSWHLYAPGERWRGPGHQVRAILSAERRTAVGFRLHDMELLATAEESRLVGHLGPDLLDPAWSPAHEAEAVRRLTADPSRELGLALLDQRVMAGVGNLYKAEVCFMLGASPWAPVSTVDSSRVVALARKLLLRNALRPEQSTTGELARGRQHWVYERGGRPCRRCGTPVRRTVQGTGLQQRSTYHCPTCQPE